MKISAVFFSLLLMLGCQPITKYTTDEEYTEEKKWDPEKGWVKNFKTSWTAHWES